MALQSRFRALPGISSRPRPNPAAAGVLGLGALPAASPLELPALAVPAAPQAQALPVDFQFGADVNAAQRNLSQMLQQTQAERSQLGSSFGFGVGSDGRVIDDPTNPYSRAAALQLAATQRARGNTNSYAARGQLYAGSLQNAQNENEHQRLMGRDALIRQFMETRSRLDQTDLAAQNAYASASEQAQAAAIQRALEQRPDPATLEAPAAAAPAPTAAKAAPKAGYQFVQDTGPRAGLSYKLVLHNGAYWRRYENGELIPRS